MGDKLISMSDAAKVTPYSQEYLSLLARRGQLKAQKIGKKWHTKIDWLNEYLSEKKPDELISEKNYHILENYKSKESSANSSKNYELSNRVMILFFAIVTFLTVAIAYQKISQKMTQIKENANQVRIINGSGNAGNQDEGGFFDFFKKEKVEF